MASLWPIALSLLVGCIQAARKMVRACLDGRFHELGPRAVLVASGYGAMPLVLLITFILVPRTSAREP